MSNKTYKQRLIDLLNNEIKIHNDNVTSFCKKCNTINHCYNCAAKKQYVHNKSRLQTYIKQVNALPANAIIPRKFRHPVINSIYLFKPELINKLYDKNQN